MYIPTRQYLKRVVRQRHKENYFSPSPGTCIAIIEPFFLRDDVKRTFTFLFLKANRSKHFPMRPNPFIPIEGTEHTCLVLANFSPLTITRDVFVIIMTCVYSRAFLKRKKRKRIL